MSLTSLFNTYGILGDIRLRKAMVIALDMEEIMLAVGKKPENIELVSSSYLENSFWFTGERKCYNRKT